MKNYKLKVSNKYFIYLILLVSSNFFNLNAQNLTYSFANAVNSTVGLDTFYEADILVSADADFKMGDGLLFFDYNTAAFGTNLVAAGSATLVLTPVVDPTYILDETVSNGGAAPVYAIAKLDGDTDTFSVSWSQTFGTESIVANNVTSTPKKLFHMKVKYANASENANLVFNTALGGEQTLTSCVGSGTPFSTCVTPGIVLGPAETALDSSGAVILGPLAWSGAISTDFSLVGNWVLGVLPIGTDDVLIPAVGVTNYPTATTAVTLASLTIESGASFIAQSTFAGAVTYKRDLGNSNWSLISSPVVGQDEDAFVAASSPELGGGSNIGFASYVANGWNYSQSGSTSGQLLTAGKGYLINLAAASGTLSFAGTMPTGDVSIALTTFGARFNLVGNPYPSYLNSANLLSASTGALESQTLWFWNPAANGGIGAYNTKVTVDAFQIAPAQGFFVQSNSGGGNLAINEVFKNHQSTDTFLKATARPEIHLNLSNANSAMESKIYYIEGTTTGFDNGYDGAVFGGAGSQSFNVFTSYIGKSDGTKLAIQSLPLNEYQNLVIPVGVQGADGTQVTFKATAMNLPSELNVYLEDVVTSTFTKLNEENASYQVTLATSGNENGRFFLHTTVATLSTTNDLALNGVSMFTTSSRNLRIQGVQNSEKASVVLHNLLGQKVFSSSFEGNGSNDLVLPSLKEGVYFVRLQTNQGKMVQKIIVD